jgi:hypothetical protein
MGIYERVKFYATDAWVRLRAWEWEWFYRGFRPISTGDRRRDERRRRKARVWLWGLGGACVGLFILIRALEILSHGGNGNATIHVVTRSLWLVYLVVQMMFLAAVAWAVKVRQGPDHAVKR